MTATDITASPSRPHRVALVVIHGVGESEPGRAVNTLVDNLAREFPAYTPVRRSEFEILTESETEATFPVVSRSARAVNGTEIEAVELHWADITNLQPGRFNMLTALFGVLFESHHLAGAMFDNERGLWPRTVRWILLAVSWLLRGPVAALMIAMSAFTLFQMFGPAPYNPMDLSELNVMLGDERHRFVLVQLGLLVLALGGLRMLSGSDASPFFDTAFWLSTLSAALLLADSYGMLGSYFLVVQPPMSTWACDEGAPITGCYVSGMAQIVISTWHGIGLVLVLVTAGLFFQKAFSRNSRPWPHFAGVSVVVIQSALWLTLTISLLLPLFNRAELLNVLSPILTDFRGMAVENGSDPDGHIASLLQYSDLGYTGIFKMKLGFAFLSILVVVFAVLAVWAIRWVTVSVSVRNSVAVAGRLSRVRYVTVIVAFLIPAFLGLQWVEFHSPQLERFESFRFVSVNLPAIAATIVTGLLGLRLGNYVRLAKDVIDHQHRPNRDLATYFFPQFFARRRAQPRRERILSRLQVTLEQRVMREGFDALIFVAHSQGSVIAFDWLRDQIAGHGALGGARPHLLTLGSPLGQVYRTYFSEYAADKPVWQEVSARIDSWTNLYRADDIIGGSIDSFAGLDVENIVMSPGGHMGYWNEPELALALHELIQRSKTPVPKVGPPPPPRKMPPLWSPVSPADLLANTPSRAMPGA